MHLTTSQAEQVRDRLRPTLGYLTRLADRMAKVNADDDLQRKVIAARDSMQDLAMTLHYLSCNGGVGR